MYYLIGTSLLFTLMLFVSLAISALTAGGWRMAEPMCRRFRPDT
jgi:hypothetical protein